MLFLFLIYLLFIPLFLLPKKDPILDLRVLYVLSFFGDYSELGLHIQMSSQLAHYLLQKELD